MFLLAILFAAIHIYEYWWIDLLSSLSISKNVLPVVVISSKINKLFNVSRNGKIFTNFKPKNSNLNKKILNKFWNLELNEVSELLEINENEFINKKF